MRGQKGGGDEVDNEKKKESLLITDRGTRRGKLFPHWAIPFKDGPLGCALSSSKPKTLMASAKSASSTPHPDGILSTLPESTSRSPSPALPEIPTANLDLTFSFGPIFGQSNGPDSRVENVQKRASNVLKLTQENEKLKEELRAMTARLEAAERKRRELDDSKQKPHYPVQQSS